MYMDGGCGPTCCAFWDRRRHALVSAVLGFFSSMYRNCEWGHACVMCEPPVPYCPLQGARTGAVEFGTGT